MKKLKRFPIFILVGILLFSLFFPACGTNNQSGNKSENISDSDTQSALITLSEAYECDLISKEDLQELASKHNHNGLQFLADLNDEKIIYDIKTLGAQKWNETHTSLFSNLTAEDMAITGVWGEYNNCWVVMVQPYQLTNASVYQPTKITIDGIEFEFTHRSYLDRLFVYTTNYTRGIKR